MNWLDVIFALILIASAVSGWVKGLVRIGVGFAATLVGFLAASWFYGSAANWLLPYLSSRTLANFLGFVLVFLAVLGLGALVSALLARVLRLAGLSWLDRLGGTAFGFLRGLLISVVLLLVILAFPLARMRDAVQESSIAPYVIETANVVAALTPYEVRQGFKKGYEQIKKVWADTLKAKPSRRIERDQS